MKQLLGIDWAKYPTGSIVTGTIKEKPFKGRISKTDYDIFLCQNVQNGAPTKLKFGFRYSYTVNSGSDVDLLRNDVEIYSITPVPDTFMESWTGFQDYDWDKIPTGSTFTAIIAGKKVNGRVFKNEEGLLWLCNNTYSNGTCDDEMGYSYSFYIGTGTLSELFHLDVSNLRVWLPEPGWKKKIGVPKMLGSYNVKSVTSESVTVGCTTVSFRQVEAIYNKMKSLQ